MENWNSEAVERLYEQYQAHVRALHRDVVTTNHSLGSSTPEKTELRELTRVEFEATLREPAMDRESVDLWVRRIIRGHEPEFPSLQAVG